MIAEPSPRDQADRAKAPQAFEPSGRLKVATRGVFTIAQARSMIANPTNFSRPGAISCWYHPTTGKELIRDPAVGERRSSWLVAATRKFYGLKVATAVAKDYQQALPSGHDQLLVRRDHRQGTSPRPAKRDRRSTWLEVSTRQFYGLAGQTAVARDNGLAWRKRNPAKVRAWARLFDRTRE